MLLLKAPDLETFEAFKKASRAAAMQIKDNTPFCMYLDVQLPDASGKPHVLKPFLVVGSPINVITPLLKDLKGTKKFLCSGVCSLEQGKINLVAHKGKLDHGLLKSRAPIFKDLFGKEVLAAAAGNQVQQAGTDQKAAAQQAGTDQKAAVQHAKLTQAALHWDGTKNIVDTRINELVRAVKAHYAKSSPELIKEIDKSMQKIDATLGKLDHRLTDSLKACAGASGPAREAELKKTKAIVEEFKRAVKSERMIAHVDQNPFGVKTNLQASLLDSLNKAEQSMV
jgi:hypothetical protein